MAEDHWIYRINNKIFISRMFLNIYAVFLPVFVYLWLFSAYIFAKGAYQCMCLSSFFDLTFINCTEIIFTIMKDILLPDSKILKSPLLVAPSVFKMRHTKCWELPLN